MILQDSSQLNGVPERIISLVPSQTELLHYLNLDKQTIGITKFCVHPAGWFKTKTKIGGTKTININTVKKLQPHLIIANKEENLREQVEQLAEDCPVWLTDVNNLIDALLMIEDIGRLTQKSTEAKDLINKIKINFAGITHLANPLRAAYLIWQKPYMSIGGDTFINDMLTRCGFQNIFVNQKRYPQVKIEELQTADCQLLLLSSEPYPFKQKHIDELSLQLPNTKIILVDGEMFSWYGSRLLIAPSYFNSLIKSLIE